MKAKEINWYTIQHRKPAQKNKSQQAIHDLVHAFFRDYPTMYSYKDNEEDATTKYQFIEPVLSDVKFMVNAKDKRMEIWIPMKCTDDEPLEM